MNEVPEVLFVCVHNAGRSQMAAALLTHLADGRVVVRSAGSAPAEAVNPAVVQALDEIGIDIRKEMPKLLTDLALREPAASPPTTPRSPGEPPTAPPTGSAPRY